MKNLGVIVIYIWLGFQIILAAGIVGYILLFHGHAPATTILLTQQETAALNPKVLQTIDGMGVMLNGLIVIVCAMLAQNIIQRDKTSRYFRQRILAWAGVIMVLGILSDIPFGNKNIFLNIISSLVLIAGLFLSYPRKK